MANDSMNLVVKMLLDAKQFKSEAPKISTLAEKLDAILERTSKQAAGTGAGFSISEKELRAFTKSMTESAKALQSFNKNLDTKQVEKTGKAIADAKDDAGGLSGVLSAGKGALAGYAAGIVSVGTALKTIKNGLEVFADAERKIKRFDAIINSTGETAGFTANQLSEMAQNAAGNNNSMADVGDIEQGIGKLLTFQNVNNAVFERAITLATDLAEVWGDDVSGAAFDLGDALNDPINEMEALAEKGIRFTDAEKELVKSLWESGQRFEAQSLILDKVNEKVGGAAKNAAEGLAGAWDETTKKWTAFTKAVGEQASPTVEKLIGFANKVLDIFTDAVKGDGLGSIEEQIKSIEEKIKREYAPSIANVQQQIKVESDAVAKAREQADKKANAEIKKDFDNLLAGFTQFNILRIQQADLTAEEWADIEQKAVDAIVKARESLANKEKSIQDQIRDLRRKTMEEGEAQADIAAEIAEKMAQAQALIKAGDNAGAQQIADNVQGLIGQLEDVDQAEQMLNKLSAVYKQATEQQIAGLEEVRAHAANQTEITVDISKAEAGIKRLEAQLDELKEERTVKINVETQELNLLQEKIDEIEQERTAKLNIATNFSITGAGFELFKRLLNGEFSGNQLPAFAAGGKLPGYSPVDDTLAWLRRGEYVVTPERTRRFEPLLNAINFGSDAQLKRLLPGYKDGGLVTPLVAPPVMPTLNPAASGQNVQELGRWTWTINQGGQTRTGTLLGESDGVKQLVNTLKQLK